MCLDRHERQLLRSLIVGAVDAAPPDSDVPVTNTWGLAKRVFGDRLTYPEFIVEVARAIGEGRVVPATLGKAKHDNNNNGGK